MAIATAYVCGSSPLNHSASAFSSDQVSLYSHFRPGFLTNGVIGSNSYNYAEFKNVCFGKKRLEKQSLSSFKFTIQASDTSGGALISSPTDQSPPATEKKDSHVRVVNITNDTLGLRAFSYERLKFEVEYGLKKGTTDNSYIIKGPAGVALIDVPDQAFTKEYIRMLMSTEDIHLLKYLVIGHLSPKRIESVIALGESLAQKCML